jgi:hypothetical protein
VVLCRRLLIVVACIGGQMVMLMMLEGVSFCFVEGRRFALGNGGVSGEEVGSYNTVDRDLLHEVVIKEEPLVFGW